MVHVPASIRSKNPGAMWGRRGPRPSLEKFVATDAPIPVRWGSTKTEYLSDGMGQGNNIAYFDTWEAGISAQADLWMNSANYHNKRFEDAIGTWSGHNSVPQYIAIMKAHVPGLQNGTIMDDAFWRGPMAIPFLKTQAAHEAGQPTYPAPEGAWAVGLAAALKGKPQAPAKNTGDLILVGDTGPGVTELQRLLGCQQTGRYTANSELEYSLKLFQIRNALDPDGKCGKITWGKLQGARV